MQNDTSIRVLIADDDEHILRCYRSAFEKRSAAASEQLIEAMESDIPRDELEQRVPPPSRLHYYSKPLSFKGLAADVARIARSSP